MLSQHIATVTTYFGKQTFRQDWNVFIFQYNMLCEIALQQS